MKGPSNCPRCQGSMVEGVILDKFDDGRRAVSSWIEGVPSKSFWGSVKLGGKEPIEIRTWRCGRCGFLESYAIK